VRVAAVERRTVPIRLRTVGTVQAWNTVQVRPQAGGLVTKVAFQEGDEVRAGQLLFEIDRRPYEAALARAQAELARDRAQLEQARADVRRYDDLARREFVTAQQLQAAKTTAAALGAAVQSDDAAVRTAQLALQYCTIRAPVPGRTGSLLVREGNLVQTANAPVLVTIQQIRPVRVAFSVPQENLPALLAAKPAPVAATPPGGKSEQGKLDFVENTVDPTTGTVLLRGTFENEDRLLWPGQSVDVVLVLGERRDALVAPAAAVQRGQSGAFVFVVKPDRTVESRQVRVLASEAGTAVIGGGLQAGETVVTDGQARLTPGARVQVGGGA